MQILLTVLFCAEQEKYCGEGSDRFRRIPILSKKEKNSKGKETKR
jgi:hypothetical protein